MNNHNNRLILEYKGKKKKNRENPENDCIPEIETLKVKESCASHDYLTRFFYILSCTRIFHFTYLSLGIKYGPKIS
jgi:hypothetical protein